MPGWAYSLPSSSRTPHLGLPRLVLLEQSRGGLPLQAQQGRGWLGHVHVHRVELLDGGERGGLIGGDQRPFRDQRAADAARDRRQHSGVDQIDACRFHRRLRLQVRGHGIVVILLADRIRFGQRLVAFRERPGGSIRRDGAVVTGLVGRRVDLIELLPCLDVAALDEQPLQNDAVDLRSHVGGTVARHASGKLGGDRHRLSLHGDDRDLRRRRGRRRGLMPTAGEQHQA